MTRAPSSSLLLWILLAAVGLGVSELASHLVLAATAGMLYEPIRRRSAILREQTERVRSLLDTSRSRREELDPELGWRYRPGYASATDNITVQGLRGSRVYDAFPGGAALRLAVFGDSFVYCNEVSDTNAWPAMLERGGAGLEVMNYGVGGTDSTNRSSDFDARECSSTRTWSLSDSPLWICGVS